MSNKTYRLIDGELVLVVCPACGSAVEWLGANGMCWSCPALSDWYDRAKPRQNKRRAAELKPSPRKHGFVQRPSGRSGRVVKQSSSSPVT